MKVVDNNCVSAGACGDAMSGFVMIPIQESETFHHVAAPVSRWSLALTVLYCITQLDGIHAKDYQDLRDLVWGLSQVFSAGFMYRNYGGCEGSEHYDLRKHMHSLNKITLFPNTYSTGNCLHN